MKSAKIQKNIIEWLQELSFAVIFAVVIFTFIFKVVAVNGDSMLPTLVSEDKLIISCIGNDYQTGDIIVMSEVLENPIIKRVIATEGQIVDINNEDGIVYVDGTPIDESIFGLPSGVTIAPNTHLEVMQFPQTVPEGHVFVLGDNRTVSEDSRYMTVGMVDERKIVGKALLRFLPFNEFGVIE